MRKVLLVLLSLCFTISVYAESNKDRESNKTIVNPPNAAAKGISTPNAQQPVKQSISPVVTINKPNQNELWQAGKSYPVEWETKFLSPGSSGTVMLSVMGPVGSNCQPVTSIPFNGQINYPVPFAKSTLGVSPHGKFMAALSVTFIDKANNKEYKDGKIIAVQYP